MFDAKLFSWASVQNRDSIKAFESGNHEQASRLQGDAREAALNALFHKAPGWRDAYERIHAGRTHEWGWPDPTDALLNYATTLEMAANILADKPEWSWFKRELESDAQYCVGLALEFEKKRKAA